MQVLNVSCFAEYGAKSEDKLPFPSAAAAAEAVAAAENATSSSDEPSTPLNSTSPPDDPASSPDSASSDMPPLSVLKAVHGGLLYQDAAALGTRTHFGLYTWYYGGGYRVSMPNDEAEAKLVLDQLKAYKWVDSATRAVFITCYMYSNALQTLAFVQYVVEFPAAGGAIVSGKVQCMKLSQLYIMDETINSIALEAVMLFGVLIYVAVELRLMYAPFSAAVSACDTVPMYSRWPYGRLAGCVQQVFIFHWFISTCRYTEANSWFVLDWTNFVLYVRARRVCICWINAAC